MGSNQHYFPIADMKGMNPQEQERNRSGQFRKGVSGNPGGRPRGRVSITHALCALAADKAAWEHGAPPEESWAERIARMLLDRASAGDMRAIALVIERIDGKARSENEPDACAK